MAPEIVKKLDERRQPVPSHLLRPPVMEGSEDILMAFYDLNADRQMTMAGPGEIPFLAIDAYARRFGFEGEEFDLLVGVIRQLSPVYLTLLREKTN